MRRIKGLRLRHKLVRIFKWTPTSYCRKLHRRSCAVPALSKLCNWVKQGTFGLSFLKSISGYIRIGEVPRPAATVPKGHLAVYVGEDEEYVHRVLVPVIYFNHPLFGDLLREAERVYGFDHPYGIQIPFPVSEFENIRTLIAAGGGSGCGYQRSWRGGFW